MGTKLTKKAKETFESIRRIDEEGVEYWTARDLARALGYTEYRNFKEVGSKAYRACVNSGVDWRQHFVPFHDMIQIGNGAERQVDNVRMTRYACYLAVQNADSSKTIVAQAQTYFAIQVRRAEKLLDTAPFTEEEEKRLMLRSEMRKHNQRLASAAKDAGVLTNKDYGVFQNAGYKGLYGGLGKEDLHARKGLGKNQQVLDHMGSTELAANLFRATQTEEKLRRDNIRGKNAANNTHFQVGRKVRETIEELGGTMPEDLPTPESIKRLEAKQKRLLSKRNPDSEKE